MWALDHAVVANMHDSRQAAIAALVSYITYMVCRVRHHAISRCLCCHAQVDFCTDAADACPYLDDEHNKRSLFESQWQCNATSMMAYEFNCAGQCAQDDGMIVIREFAAKSWANGDCVA